MNASDGVITAIGQELGEVRKVALQNRLALDIILASSGGTCAKIGTECYSFVSNASDAIAKFHAENKRGIQMLTESHGWVAWDLLDNAFSGGDASH